MADHHTSKEVLLEDAKSRVSIDEVEDAGSIGIESIGDQVDLPYELAVHIKIM
jgi:hypothetical protein